jgi:hypothetical protein
MPYSLVKGQKIRSDPVNRGQKQHCLGFIFPYDLPFCGALVLSVRAATFCTCCVAIALSLSGRERPIGGIRTCLN